MDASDIKFNTNLKIPIKIDQQPESVSLELSDDLEASEQELGMPYKEKIAKFVNASGTWLPLAYERINSKEGASGKIRLLKIYVLSEQDEDSIVFGLMFRVEKDIEHGRGMKVDGETLKIVKYGSADVAFS